MSETRPKQPQPKLPFLAHALVRYILGFGVSVAVGLAPFLGRLNVPLFTPLLALMPATLQNFAIPVSAAFMGLVAVAVQRYGDERVSKEWSRKNFFRTLYFAVACLLLLIIFYPFAVATVKLGRDGKDASFVVGVIDPDKPPCPSADAMRELVKAGREPDCNPCLGISPEECISVIGTGDDKIKSHWGSRQIALVSLALILPYLGFMTSFGLLVGLLLLEQKRVQDARQVRALRVQRAAARNAQGKNGPARS